MEFKRREEDQLALLYADPFDAEAQKKIEATIRQDNVLRVGGGEVSVPFLAEKDIPAHFLDEDGYKQASSSGTPAAVETKESKDAPSGSQSTGVSRANPSESPEFEGKVGKLVELGFERSGVIEALKLFDGNEEQAAGFLFEG